MKTFNQFICEEKTPIPQINKDQFLEMLDKNKFDDQFLIHFTDSDKFPSKERHVYIPPEGVKDGRTISIPKQSGIFCWTLGEYKEKVKSALKYPEEHSGISSWFYRRKFLYLFAIKQTVKQFVASKYNQEQLEKDLKKLEKAGYSKLWSSLLDTNALPSLFDFMEFERGDLFANYSLSTQEKSPVSLLKLIQRLFEEHKKTGGDEVKQLADSIFPSSGKMPLGNWKNALNSKEKPCFYVYVALKGNLIKEQDISFLEEDVSIKLKTILEQLSLEYNNKDSTTFKRVDVEKTLKVLYQHNQHLFEPKDHDRPQKEVSKETYLEQLRAFIEKHTKQDYSNFPAFILWATILFLSHADYKLFKTLFKDVLNYSVIFDDEDRSLVNGFFKDPISSGYGKNEWVISLISGEGKQQIILDESVLDVKYRVKLND